MLRPFDRSLTVIAATSLNKDDLLWIGLRIDDELSIDLMAVPVFYSLLILVDVNLSLVVT